MKIQTVCDNRIFGRAYRKGKKRAGRYIVVYVIKGRGKCCRLGITVTKGRGSAVVRNRIKRIIRAAWRDVAARCTLTEGCDVIVVARDAAADAKSTEIAPELEDMLVALGAAEKKSEPEPSEETEDAENAESEIALTSAVTAPTASLSVEND